MGVFGFRRNRERSTATTGERKSSVYYCDVAIAQINYPIVKQNTQDSIEQARGRSHKEG
jgi:hypothetical protein